jgi:hypothetical protein
MRSRTRSTPIDRSGLAYAATMSDITPPLRPASGFWPIGYFRAELIDDIIHVASSGEFNWECAQQFRHGLLELVGRLPPVFGILSEFDVAPIMTPEVEALMARLTAEGMQFGFLASAFVSRRPEGVGIAQAQWGRIYARLGLEIRFFDDTAAAQQWLGETLARKRNSP